MSNKSLPKIKKVVVSEISGEQQLERILVVSKMPLGRYGQFMQELEKIPETLKAVTKMFLGDGTKKEDFQKAAEERGDSEQAKEISQSDEVTNDQMIEAVFSIPGILTKHWDDLVMMLSIASGVEEEVLRKIDLDEATQVVVAVIEVNNFFGIGDRYLEIMGRKANAQRGAMTVPQAPKKKRKK